MTPTQQSSRWRLLVPTALAVGVLAGAAREAASGVIGGDRWNWAEMAVHVMGWALIMPLSWWFGRFVVDRGWLARHPARLDRDRRARSSRPSSTAACCPTESTAMTVWAVAAVVAAQGAAAVRLTWPRLHTARRLLAELTDGEPAGRRVGS